MSGVLLSPGPVSTATSVHRLSRVFNNAVNKSKFLAAAKKLGDMNMGHLVTIKTNNNKEVDVFIKNLPQDMSDVILQNSDICTFEEYVQRFQLSAPMSINDNLRESLISLNLVNPERFV